MTKKNLKRCIIIIVFLLVVLSTAIASMVYYTPFRNWAITHIATTIAHLYDYTLTWESIDTSDPYHWHIQELTLGGAHQIRAQSLELRWKNHDMVNGDFDITQLALTALTIDEQIIGTSDTQLTIRNAFSAIKITGTSDFNGTFNTLPLALHINASATKNLLTLNQLLLTSEMGGTMDITGNYNQGHLDFKVQSHALPIEQFFEFGKSINPGTLASKLHLNGTLDTPSITGTITFDTTLYDHATTHIITTDINVKTIESDLHAQIDFTKGRKNMGQLTLTLPLFSYLRTTPHSLDALPLHGSLLTHFDLRYIQTLLPPDIHHIRGIINADLTIAGSINAPLINGTAELKNGYYDNSQSGTTLHDINVKLEADNTHMRIVKAYASDGESGQLTLSGRANWSSPKNPMVDFKLSTKDAKLLRRDDMEGVANGTLSLAGTPLALALTGTLDIAPLAINLDTLLLDEIPEIDVTETFDHTTADTTNTIPLPTIMLDIMLKASHQAFLRGKGLDAELEGYIHVKGPLHSSNYSGKFNVVRGSYEVLGKKFTIEEGTTFFEGEAVSLHILGIHRTNDIRINAQLSGNIEALTLTLSSIPALPQDEIISRLLFGKSSANITPLQAIKLANAISQLKNGGPALFDPIGTARKILGVDSLSVDSQTTDEGNEVTIGAGKYIHEKVFIEIEKSNDPAKPLKGKVEAEISPNLNIESSTGGNSGLGGIELQWKYDY